MSNEEQNNEQTADEESPIEIEIPEGVMSDGEDANDEHAAQLQDAEERVLRVQAELENFRRRSRRELQDSLKYANQSLMTDLLTTIDNLDRAIGAAANDAETSGLLDGVKMVSQQLLDTLGKHGCERIEALGETFDPNCHEAISQGPSDEYENGNIMLVALEGYKLHDRILRPSQVIISTGPADA